MTPKPDLSNLYTTYIESDEIGKLAVATLGSMYEDDWYLKVKSFYVEKESLPGGSVRLTPVIEFAVVGA